MSRYKQKKPVLFFQKLVYRFAASWKLDTSLKLQPVEVTGYSLLDRIIQSEKPRDSIINIQTLLDEEIQKHLSTPYPASVCA